MIAREIERYRNLGTRMDTNDAIPGGTPIHYLSQWM